MPHGCGYGIDGLPLELRARVAACPAPRRTTFELGRPSCPRAPPWNWGPSTCRHRPIARNVVRAFTSFHIISFVSMSVLALAPSPAPSPAAVLAQIVLVFCLRGSMQIFVEWWSGKTIKLEVAAWYTIDTVKAKILAQEGTPLDEQRLIWFGETLEGGCTLAEHNIKDQSTLHMAEETSRSRNKRLRIEPRRSNRWSRRCSPPCSFCEELVLRPMVVNRCPICNVWLHTDCLREHCLLHHPGVHVKGCEWGPREHHPGQAAGDAPLGEWGPREQAEWNQRVRGSDYYLMCGEQDGRDSDMIAEMSGRNWSRS